MKPYLPIILAFGLYTCTQKNTPHKAGQAWNNTVQQIPGKIECEFYNRGGEGIAYHDADSINNGSGKLNPADGTFLNEFRMQEGVDISYTKARDIDNTKYNKVMPEMNQLYVGWTENSEWIKYYVIVKESGTYTIGLMYTANGDGLISIDIDDKPIAENLKVVSTYDPTEPVAWRQWHHWNKAEGLAVVKLKKGIHTLTLHTVEHGNMNFDYLEFKTIN